MTMRDAIAGWLASLEKSAQYVQPMQPMQPVQPMPVAQTPYTGKYKMPVFAPSDLDDDPLPPPGRLLIDGKATRQSIMDSMKEAVTKRFPIENDKYRIELSDVKYEGPTRYSLEQQKQAILNNRKLGCSLAGTWKLIDKATGKVIDQRRDAVMRVPYYTDRGTIINNGSEFTVISQARLSPGVYARQKQNGELEAQFNVANGKGFRLELDKKTGRVGMRMGQANIPLYPLLKAFGVPDKDISGAWGHDVAISNAEAKGTDAVARLYTHIAGYQANQSLTDAQKATYIKEELAKFGLDPNTVVRTLGIENVKGVTPEVLLRASQKLLNINRGIEQQDNRDNPRFSKFYGIEHMLGERVNKDVGKLTKAMLFKCGRDKSLQRVGRNALNPYIDDFLSASGLAQPGEEANPMSVLIQQTRITRTGEGGISSPDLITPEARGVQGDYLGFVDFIAGPESQSAGVDVRASFGTILGKDNKLYNVFRNLKTGKKEYLSLDAAADKCIAFPGQDPKSEYLYCMRDGVPTKCKASEADYMVPSFSRTIGAGINMNPLVTAVFGQRSFYSSKFWEQYLPQKKGEVPLVDTLMPDGKMTFNEYYGRRAGCVTSPIDGVVTAVTKDSITVRGKDGKTETMDLVTNYPNNRMTQITTIPVVKKGMEIKKGGILANTNFTDAKTGAFNMGQNLKVAVLPSPRNANSFEDAIVISEDAAKKLSTTRLYNFEQDTKNGVQVAKNKFLAAFPDVYTKAQADTLDDNGVVKVGTTLNRGDPIIAALGPKLLSAENAQLGKLSSVLKNALTDKSQTWNHDWPGVVTDVVAGPRGAKVLIKSEPPVKVGDKLSGRFALKGVVGTVLPMDKMPRDAVTNEPYDILMNPMGFLSRVAPGQLMEIALGKVAKKTGQQMRIPQLPPEGGWLKWTQKQLKDAGVSETADVFDPQTGRTIKGVGDGYVYTSAMHHLAEKKFSARGIEGGYTQDQQPAKGGIDGAKKIGGFDVNALLSHGATEVLKDSMTVRGNQNADYWRKLRLGLQIPEPGVPFIYEKFLNNLRAGGINVVEKGDVTSIMPHTDKSIEEMAGGRVIDSAQMVDADMNPVTGGLFDPAKTGGAGGTRWSMIELPEPVPNPVMEEPVRRVLGLTVKGMQDILSGREKVNGKTGGAAIRDMLANVNTDKMIEQARYDIKNKRGSTRDNAVKVLGYLTSAKKMNVAPADWMISKVPVLPPAFRGIAKMGDTALVPDANELYKELLESKHNYALLKSALPDSALTEERLGIYRAVKAAFGLGDSITTEGQAKNLKGPIRQVLGTIPKFGQYQSKVISKNQDLTGRSVTVPDKNLDMDQVGLPEDMAWTMYKPFVIRGLTQRGYDALTAAKMIEDRTPAARHILEDVMKVKPVLMDRAPTWHKFNIMAFRPFIVDGHEIKVSPLIDSGFTMDHDGDESRSPYIKTFLSEKFLKDRLVTTDSGLCYNPSTTKLVVEGEAMRKESVIIDGENIPGVIVNMRWEDFPHYENPTMNSHPNARFYAVPEGVCVRAYDEKSGETVWAPVRYWSHHGVNDKLEIVTVELSSGRQILTDDDPRGVYGIDPKTMEFGRWRPSDAIGKFVPRCIKDDTQFLVIDKIDASKYGDCGLSHTITLDRIAGWFFGAMIGDGWATHDNGRAINICFCYDRNYNDLGESFRKSVMHTFYADAEVHFGEIVHDKVEEANRYGNAITVRHSCSSIARFVNEVIGHGAANKHLPPFWHNAPKDFKLGLFEGLLDTDGTLALVKAKAKKTCQLMCNYSTTSMTLATEVQYLCRTLGVDSKLTTQKTPAGGKCWQVSISTKNLKSLGLELKSTHKAKALAEAVIKTGGAGGRSYIVPVPADELKSITRLLLALDRNAYASVMKTSKDGYVTIKGAEKIAKVLKAAPELVTPKWQAWLSLYNNIDNIVWERVEGFTNTGMYEDGFDLTVPGYETFMNSEGVILSNTVNIHLPASEKASKEALEKMLPSKNLISLTDLKSVRYKPEKEQVSGLWALTRPSETNKKPVVFNSREDVLKAYRRGEIDPTDPVVIR